MTVYVILGDIYTQGILNKKITSNVNEAFIDHKWNHKSKMSVSLLKLQP